MPEFIDEALESVELVKDLSKRYNYARDFFYLGRGYSYPTALEGALKLKEITYIHGEGYAIPCYNCGYIFNFVFF